VHLLYVLKEVFLIVRGNGREAKAAALAMVGGLAAVFIVCVTTLWWLLSGSPALYAIEGNVVFKGQRADCGIVIFEPQAGARIPTRTAEIVDGRFALRRSSGLQRNAEYRVRVEVLRKTGKTFDTADEGKTSDEYEKVHRSEEGGVEPASFVATRANVKNVLQVSVGE